MRTGCIAEIGHKSRDNKANANERALRETFMNSNIDAKIGRRGFLKGVAAATGAVPLAPQLPFAVGVGRSFCGEA
jgi:hypothetical protein